MTIGIVLIHLGRCGSTVLGNLLNQHSEISWYGEIFEPLFRAARKPGIESPNLHGDPVQLAAKAIQNSPSRYGGIEIKPFHIDAFSIALPEFIAGMRQNGFRYFIVLDRRNRLRKIVSSRLAALTGIWHVPANAPRSIPTFTLDIENLQMDRKKGSVAQVLQSYDLEFEEVRSTLSPNYLDLFYEDHIESDPRCGYHMILDYIGLNREPAIVKLGRTTATPLSQVIENYKDLERQLAGTRYAWMLNDKSN